MPGGELYEELFSKGDVMRRLDTIEQRIQELMAGRRLQSASIGAGGLRIKGGSIRAQDAVGEDMIRFGGTPGEVFIREDLLTPLSMAIFADRIKFGIEPSIRGITASDYELDDPVVSDVEVSETGVMLVFLTCLWQLSADVDLITCTMGAEISGASQVSASAFGAYGGENQVGINEVQQWSGQHTTLSIVTGLEPGVHNLQAAYGRPAHTGVAAGSALNRQIAVIGL